MISDKKSFLNFSWITDIKIFVNLVTIFKISQSFEIIHKVIIYGIRLVIKKFQLLTIKISIRYEDFSKLGLEVVTYICKSSIYNWQADSY